MYETQKLCFNYAIINIILKFYTVLLVSLNAAHSTIRQKQCFAKFSCCRH